MLAYASDLLIKNNGVEMSHMKDGELEELADKHACV